MHEDTSTFAIGFRPGSGPASFPGRAHVLNDLFMVNAWPVVASLAPATPGDSMMGWHYPMISMGVRPLVISRVATDTVAFHSDVIGAIRVRLDAQGRPIEIDGMGSNWNLRGERVGWLDRDSLALAFLERERREGPLGLISPEASLKATVHAASIRIDYGRPYKRGREIFGGIVPWGRVWRTGAGPATHLKTDRPLTFGSATVPAREYTIWTIPAPEGWTLIVNHQTGQWGTFYDERHDLVRIPLVVESLDEPIEQFTIQIEERAQGGLLRLLWDKTEARAEFAVL